MTGMWPIRWTPSRRRLAVSPISRSAGRFVGRFPIPKSLVSVMVVSVRGAFPYCLIVVCLSSTCRLGVTPAVITLVRNRPGVARGPRRIGRGSKMRPT